MKDIRIKRIVSLLIVIVLCFSNLLECVDSEQFAGFYVAADDFDSFVEVSQHAQIYNKYGGVSELDLFLVTKDDRYYIPAELAAYIGGMDGQVQFNENSVVFKRNVRSLIDEGTILDTISRTYSGEIKNYQFYTLVDMEEVFNLLEIECAYDGTTLSLRPMIYLDDELSIVLDEIVNSYRYEIESITGLERVSAVVYKNFRDKDLLGLITGRTFVNDYKQVLANMICPQVEVNEKCKEFKESKDVVNLTGMTLAYGGPMADSLRSSFFTGFKSDVQANLYTDPFDNFLDIIGLGEYSWIKSTVNSGSQAGEAVGFALSYQNARQVDYWYVDALYYGVVLPGGDNSSSTYTYDCSYMTSAANSIYDMVDDCIAPTLSSEVLQKFVDTYIEKNDNYIWAYVQNQELTDFEAIYNSEFSYLEMATQAALDAIGANQEIDNAINTVICSSIAERAKNSYLYNRGVNAKAMKYSVLMYLLASEYYCDTYDDYPTMMASVMGWSESDSAYFSNVKREIEDLIAKIVAIDDLHTSMSSEFDYSVYDANDHLLYSCGRLEYNPKYYTPVEPLKAKVYGYRGSERKVVVPASFHGAPVVEISGSYSLGAYRNYSSFNAPRMTELVLPDTLLKIGEYAFAGCSQITELTIPNSVAEIGYGAFRDCSSLTTIDMPNYLTSIGSWAFENCTSLQSLQIRGYGLELYGTFKNCTNLENVTIQSENASLKLETFYGCKNLQSVSLPDDIEYTVSYSSGERFYNCESLQYISLPSATVIGEKDFAGCSSLSVIYAPNIEEVKEDAFYGCSCLKTVSFPKLRKIGRRAFYECAITEFDFPLLESIDNLAFEKSFADPAVHDYQPIIWYLPHVVPEFLFMEGAKDYMIGNEYCGFINTVHSSGIETGQTDNNVLVTRRYPLICYASCDVYEDYQNSIIGQLRPNGFVLRALHTYDSHGVCSHCGAVRQLEIDEGYFPDPYFRDYVSTNFDSDSDGWLSQEELDSVTSIEIINQLKSAEGIKSLRGIEHFQNLESLVIRRSMKYYGIYIFCDLSSNVNLKNLEVYDTRIKKLDLSQNVNLESITCIANELLESFDISNCSKLKRLSFAGNGGYWTEHPEETEEPLVTLDISGCPLLSHLRYNDSDFALDIRHCPYIVRAYTEGVKTNDGWSRYYSSYDDEYYLELIGDSQIICDRPETTATPTPFPTVEPTPEIEPEEEYIEGTLIEDETYEVIIDGVKHYSLSFTAEAEGYYVFICSDNVDLCIESDCEEWYIDGKTVVYLYEDDVCQITEFGWPEDEENPEVGEVLVSKYEFDGADSITNVYVNDEYIDVIYGDDFTLGVEVSCSEECDITYNWIISDDEGGYLTFETKVPYLTLNSEGLIDLSYYSIDDDYVSPLCYLPVVCEVSFDNGEKEIIRSVQMDICIYIDEIHMSVLYSDEEDFYLCYGESVSLETFADSPVECDISYEWLIYNEEEDDYVPISNSNSSSLTFDTLEWIDIQSFEDAEDSISIYIKCVATFDSGEQSVYDDCYFYLTVYWEEDLTPAQVLKSSLAMEDRIGVNFFLDLPDEFLEDEGAYIQINELQYSIPSKDNRGRYPFRYYIAAAQQRDDIVLTAHLSDGTVYPLLDKAGEDVTSTGYVYSGINYTAEARNGGAAATLLDMLDRLNDFGKYAQDYFGYYPELGEYTDRAGDIDNVTLAMLNRYAPVITATANCGIRRSGSTLMLESATTVTHNFIIDRGTVDDYIFMVDGKVITTESIGDITLKLVEGKYRISIGNIVAAHLQDSYEVVVTDKTGNELIRISNYSALSYAQVVISHYGETPADETNAKLVNMLKSLYLYNRAAMVWFQVEEEEVPAPSTLEAEEEAVIADEEPVAEEEAIAEPVIEEPVEEEITEETEETEESASEEPITEEPIAEELVTEEPAIELQTEE